MLPALVAVRTAVRAALPARGLVLVACSGGPDSLALAGALAREAPGRCGLVTVDHGLQAGSGQRAASVAALGVSLGFTPSEVATVVVEESGHGPEAAARDARYAALTEAASRHGAVAILLGHTRDDQAEQVLLGLARGSGPTSLAGMRARRGIFRRPLLELDRAVVHQACIELGLNPWDDPHNADPAYLRSRVRSRVLPVLEAELGPGVAAALARTAAALARDADALDQLATAALTDCRAGDDLLVDALADLHPAIRTRVLRLAARGAGANALTATHTASMDRLVTGWRGQGPVALPGGLRCTRQQGRLVFLGCTLTEAG